MNFPPIDRRRFLNVSTALPLAGTSACAAGVNQGFSRNSNQLNPQIQHARNVALDILKPNKRDLEHGLELHAQSLVFDGYGFSPRAAMDGDAYAEAVRQGASEIELQDLREDMNMTRCVTDPEEQEEYRQAWDASGVTCVFQNAGEEGQDPLRLLKRLARFTYVTDMMRTFVKKAATPDDVLEANRQRQHCLYFTGNGVPLTQDWISTADELRYLKIFFQLGIRMMHLTYQRRNMIGDGCAEKANAGLSDFGRSVVQEMNRIGVIVDCAHSGWQTSLEAAKLSARPMVASHTTCAGIHPHIRSKPDNVIRAIADTGGYVGMCCIPSFLRGKGDISAFLDHVDYVVRKFGVQHVAIGTDVAYSSQRSAEQRKKVPKQPRTRKQWRSLWPTDDYVTTAEARTSLSWTNWPLFTVGLVQRGYRDSDIQKIIGTNVLRVAKSALEV